MILGMGDDRVLVLLYRVWSEETWRAGFITPDPDRVAAFRKWLAGGGEFGEFHKPLEDYESHRNVNRYFLGVAQLALEGGDISNGEV